MYAAEVPGKDELVAIKYFHREAYRDAPEVNQLARELQVPARRPLTLGPCLCLPRRCCARPEAH